MRGPNPAPTHTSVLHQSGVASITPVYICTAMTPHVQMYGYYVGSLHVGVPQ